MEIEVINLSKSLKNKIIFDNINISLKTGDSLALRGHNGAGKSSLLRCLSSIDRDYTGSINIKEDTVIGLVPQEIILFEELSVIDNFKIFSTKGSRGTTDKIEEFSAYFKITPILKYKVKELSGGQKRLINFLVGLINDPDLMLLDEITVGVDSDTLSKMITYLKEKVSSSIMIITSHDEEFLSQICNCSIEIRVDK